MGGRRGRRVLGGERGGAGVQGIGCQEMRCIGPKLDHRPSPLARPERSAALRPRDDQSIYRHPTDCHGIAKILKHTLGQTPLPFHIGPELGAPKVQHQGSPKHPEHVSRGIPLDLRGLAASVVPS